MTTIGELEVHIQRERLGLPARLLDPDLAGGRLGASAASRDGAERAGEAPDRVSGPGDADPDLLSPAPGAIPGRAWPRSSAGQTAGDIHGAGRGASPRLSTGDPAEAIADVRRRAASEIRMLRADLQIWRRPKYAAVMAREIAVTERSIDAIRYVASGWFRRRP